LAVCFEGQIIGGAWTEATDEDPEWRYFPADDLPEPVRQHLYERVTDWKRELSYAVWRSQ
jgi:hypothetical protein